MKYAVGVVLVWMVLVLMLPPTPASYISSFSEPITLKDDGVVSIALRPTMDTTPQVSHAKPTWVILGVVTGFSLPTYAANEEIFFRAMMPRRWDGISDFCGDPCVYIPAASQSSKKFNLSIDYAWCSPGDAMPSTSYTTFVETTCSSDTANTVYHPEFTIDYDVAGVGNEIAAGDHLYLRLYRTSASASEITGEAVVSDFVLKFNRDKLGVA